MPATIEQTILTNLAALHTTLMTSGIRTVFPYAPFSIAPQSLPAIVVFTGQDIPTGKGASAWYELVRDYECRYYVRQAQQGETNDVETACIPFIALGRDLYLSHPSLNPGPAAGNQAPLVMDSKYYGCSGVAIMADYAGTQFVGIVHKIKVTYKVPYNYGNYE